MQSMAITMQGNWTLRVKHGSAEAQRFVVAGAVIGNGHYEAAPDTALFVAGREWTLHLQCRIGEPAGASAWRDAPAELGLPGVCAGQVRLDIAAAPQHTPDQALVLACSTPVSEADYIVHGAVRRYSGVCLFNPGRHDYMVIDSALHLHGLCERYPALRAAIDKLHPDCLRRSIDAMPGAAWTPCVLPTGLPNVANGLVFRSQPRLPSDDLAEAGDGEPPAATITTVMRAAFEATTLKAGAAMLTPQDLQALAAVRERAIRSRWSMEPAPGVRLRFLAYERSQGEHQGGPYTGSGLRTDLGMSVSDGRGHYLFRLHRPSVDQGGALPPRPDVIVQVPGHGTAPAFETAPYNNITNLLRVDLWVPASAAMAAVAGRQQAERRRHGVAALPLRITGRRAGDPANSPTGGAPGDGGRPRYG